MPIIAAAIAFLLSLLIWFGGSENVETPAGYVGYVRQGAAFGQTKFIGLQTGPTSSGRSWMYEVQNISITPSTNHEAWTGADTLPAKDKLPMQFSANIIWKLNAEKVREFVEKYGGLDEQASPDEISEEAYKQFIQPQFRNICRDEVSKYNGLELNEHISEINKNIYTTLVSKLKGSPFDVIETVTGFCVPPKAVTEQIAMKVAKTQEDQRKATELSIAEKQLAIEKALGAASAAKEVEEAKGKAEAITAINKALTKEYLTYEAVKGMSGAQRVYIPTGANGLPVVGSLPIGN